MNYILKIPVIINPDSVRDITNKMLIDIFLLKQGCVFPSRLNESKLRIEAIKNIIPSNLYFYTSECMVGKKKVEYKYQSGEDINNYSLFYLN